MPVFKNEDNGTWYVMARYMNWKGERKQKCKSQNRQLTSDNNRLREEIKDYKLLRKVFGSRQIDSLLEQARQSKQRGTRFRNNQYER